MSEPFPITVPEIPVADVALAAAYYRDHLGFTVDWGGEEGGIASDVDGNRFRVFYVDSWETREG